MHGGWKMLAELGSSSGQVDIGLWQWAQAVAWGRRGGKLGHAKLREPRQYLVGTDSAVGGSVNHQGWWTRGAAVGSGGGQIKAQCV